MEGGTLASYLTCYKKEPPVVHEQAARRDGLLLATIAHDQRPDGAHEEARLKVKNAYSVVLPLDFNLLFKTKKIVIINKGEHNVRQ